MAKIRIRLTNVHYFWILSVLVSFFYGLMDKQCYLSGENLPSGFPKIFHHTMKSPLNLFAAIREDHEEIIEELFKDSQQISYSSFGTLLWTHFAITKSYTWYRSEKESARLNLAGCSKFVMKDALSSGIGGAEIEPYEGSPSYTAGKLFSMPLYRKIFAADWNKEFVELETDPSVITRLIDQDLCLKDPKYKSGYCPSKKMSIKAMREALSNNLLKDFNNYKGLNDLRIVIVIQHPRQYALELANQRSELPDSGLYLDILKEYVQLISHLTAQCDAINSSQSGGCIYLRIEDIISNPSKTLYIDDLSPPKIKRNANFEDIPAFEKDIEEILFENKAVKKFLQKHQYHLSDVEKMVLPVSLS